MPSILDVDQVPGYRTNIGAPETYAVPDQTRWTKNAFTNATFRLRRRNNGSFGTVSAHRVRAMDLVGSQTTIVRDDYDSAQSPLLHLALPKQQTYLIEQMPYAASEVTIVFGAAALLDSVAHKIAVSANNVFLFDVFQSGASDYPATSGATVRLTALAWNSMLNANGDDVDVTFSFVPSSGTFTSAAHWMRFRVRYTPTSTVNETFVNEEVAFPHRGYGLERRGDGTFQPVSIIQPDRDRPAFVTRGILWRVKSDPDFVPSQRPPSGRLGNIDSAPSKYSALGASGLFVFMIPMETPPVIEGVFASYPVVCGIPY